VDSSPGKVEFTRSRGRNRVRSSRVYR
jgi:hypothetical protein